MTGAGQSSPTKSVLIVDDDRALGSLYRDLLEEAGYVARHESSGASALAWLAETTTPPDLILLDCAMPRMSGEEFVAALAGVSPTLRGSTRIVAFTGFRAGSSSTEKLASLVDGFVEKPDDIDEFVRVIRELAPLAP